MLKWLKRLGWWVLYGVVKLTPAKAVKAAVLAKIKGNATAGEPKPEPEKTKFNTSRLDLRREQQKKENPNGKQS